MAESAKKRTSKPTGKAAGSSAPPPEHEERGAPTCTVGFCPICLTVTAMQPLRPDVIEHLLVAGRELLLAARAVVDARSEQLVEDSGTTRRKGSVRLEKIDIG
jgi:hypothetical protein